jgi:hypothetical protein
MKLRNAVCVILAGALLAGCGDKCKEYSKYTCDQIEKANYNVYFYFPDGEEKSLGATSGLQQCSAMAADYSNSTGAPKNWICCMATDSSSCEEKHR